MFRWVSQMIGSFDVDATKPDKEGAGRVFFRLQRNVTHHSIASQKMRLQQMRSMIEN